MTPRRFAGAAAIAGPHVVDRGDGWNPLPPGKIRQRCPRHSPPGHVIGGPARRSPLLTQSQRPKGAALYCTTNIE